MADVVGSVSFAWGDGEHKFCLRIGELREFEAKREAGTLEVVDRILSRRWRVDDLREAIRLGLIGGGMTPVDAHVLCVRYVDNRPKVESVEPALRILLAALEGDPKDKVGKKKAGMTKRKATSASSPRQSTEQAQS